MARGLHGGGGYHHGGYHHHHHGGRWIGRGFYDGGPAYYDSGCPWGWRSDAYGTPYLACVPSAVPMLGATESASKLTTVLIAGAAVVGLLYLAKKST